MLTANNTSPKSKNRSVSISRLARLRYGIAIGIGVALLVLVVWSAGLFNSFRLRITNIQYTERPTSDQVVIVALDDDSLAEYGRISNWSRTLYADLINELTADGASVIAFDVLFAESSIDPTEDEVLASAIADARRSDTHTRVVMPISGERAIATTTPYEIQYLSFIGATPTIAQNARNFGFINAIPDTDGILRGQHLRAKNSATDRYEVPLSIAAYVSYYNISYAMLEIEDVYRVDDDNIHLIDMSIPVDQEGRMLINFFGNPQVDDSFAVYSFKDVVQGNVPDSAFADKIVLVGALNATGLTDTYPVPLGGDSSSMAGVAIHANIIETLISEWFLTEQSQSFQVMVIIILAMLTSIMLTQLTWRWILGIMPIMVIFWFVGAVSYGNLNFVVMNLFDPLLAILFPLPIALALNVYLETNRRRWIEILLDGAIRTSNQQLDRELIIETVAEDAHYILESKKLEIWLWDDYNEELMSAYPVSDEPKTTVIKLKPLPTDNKFLQLAKQALTSQETLEEPHYIAIPLLWKDERLGVLVTQQKNKTLSYMQRQVMRLFILQTTAMLANSQLYIESQALSEFKTRMIRMASHDLKNPIGVVYGYIDLLVDEPEFMAKLDDEQKRYLDIITQTAEQMNGIVDDILNLERVRAGNIIQESYLLHYLVESAVSRFKYQAEQKSQTFTAEIASDLPVMVGDEQQLREAINNIVGNAIKYTPDGGAISIELSQKDHKAQIKIQDNGYGISKEAQTQLFQEFYRVRTEENAHVQGTGLGLSLVKSIIMAHKGRVWVESDTGQGSTFYIELPIPEDAQQPPISDD